MAIEPAPEQHAPVEGGVSAYLELLGGRDVRPRLFPLHDEVVIGRDRQDALASDQFICIPMHTISRRHARVRRRGEDWSGEDQHTSNGTVVKGERQQPA
jgi:3',5'-cyclic-nucleotide phosphodiesterase